LIEGLAAALMAPTARAGGSPRGRATAGRTDAPAAFAALGRERQRPAGQAWNV